MFNHHKPTPGGPHRPPLSPNRASSPQPHGEVSEMRLASPQHGPQAVIPCCWLSCTLARTLGEPWGCCCKKALGSTDHGSRSEQCLRH